MQKTLIERKIFDFDRQGAYNMAESPEFVT